MDARYRCAELTKKPLKTLQLINKHGQHTTTIINRKHSIGSTSPICQQKRCIILRKNKNKVKGKQLK